MGIILTLSLLHKEICLTICEYVCQHKDETLHMQLTLNICFSYLK